MTTMPSPPGPPLTNDDVMVAFLDRLLQNAIRRQIWFLFLDDDQRLMSPVMPNDDFPDDPHEAITVDDLGRCTAAELIAARFAMLQDEIGASHLLVVWERPGDRSLSDQDREWARTLGPALVAAGARLRGQLLLSTDGHRVIAPDDLI